MSSQDALDSDTESIASLPDSAPSDDIDPEFPSHEDESDAEHEWRENLQQLEMVLTMVAVPWFGKYLGRKFAYWSFAKYMEWKYPVEVIITSKAAFRGAGAIEAAASL